MGVFAEFEHATIVDRISAGNASDFLLSGLVRCGSCGRARERGKLSPERCDERLGRLQGRVADLRAQEAELAEITADDGADGPTSADLAAVAQRLADVIADAQPEKAKALLRLLIAELRVHSKTDIQPTYRVITPAVAQRQKKWRRRESNPGPRSRERWLLRA